MKEDFIKSVLIGFVLLSMVVCAIVIGNKKKQMPIEELPKPIMPVLPEPLKKEKETATPSFIRGYHDGYSGAWLSPGQWIIISEYRNGWEIGNFEFRSGKPNRFLK